MKILLPFALLAVALPALAQTPDLAALTAETKKAVLPVVPKVVAAMQEAVAEKGVAVRVVSMPSNFMFDQQGKAYRDAVLPRGVPRVAVEAGVSDYWRKYVGLEGAVVGIDRFGECGPAAQVFEYLGVTADKVVAAVKDVIAG